MDSKDDPARISLSDSRKWLKLDHIKLPVTLELRPSVTPSAAPDRPKSQIPVWQGRRRLSDESKTGRSQQEDVNNLGAKGSRHLYKCSTSTLTSDKYDDRETSRSGTNALRTSYHSTSALERRSRSRRHIRTFLNSTSHLDSIDERKPLLPAQGSNLFKGRLTSKGGSVGKTVDMGESAGKVGSTGKGRTCPSRIPRRKPPQLLDKYCPFISYPSSIFNDLEDSASYYLKSELGSSKLLFKSTKLSSLRTPFLSTPLLDNKRCSCGSARSTPLQKLLSSATLLSKKDNKTSRCPPSKPRSLLDRSSLSQREYMTMLSKPRNPKRLEEPQRSPNRVEKSEKSIPTTYDKCEKFLKTKCEKCERSVSTKCEKCKKCEPSRACQKSISSRCEKYKLAPCPPRVVQMAMPTKRHVLASWQAYGHVLPAEKLEKFDKLLKGGDTALDVRDARWYFEHLDRKKRHLRSRRKCKCGDECHTNFNWLKCQINETADAILEYFQKEPLYMLNFTEMVMSDEILNWLERRKVIKFRFRSTKDVYKRTIIDICDKMVTWMDKLNYFINMKPLSSKEEIALLSQFSSETLSSDETELETDEEENYVADEEDLVGCEERIKDKIDESETGDKINDQEEEGEELEVEEKYRDDDEVQLKDEWINLFSKNFDVNDSEGQTTTESDDNVVEGKEWKITENQTTSGRTSQGETTEEESSYGDAVEML